MDGILGYLNFSSGAEDAAFLKQLDEVFDWLEQRKIRFPYTTAGEMLQKRLQQLRKTNLAFSDAQQADRAVRLLHEKVVPGYLKFHGFTLSHIHASHVINAFFLGRAAEATLIAMQDHPDDSAAATAAIGRLNDYVGHRPVATLQNKPHAPYPHEWIRPVPLYIRGVGVLRGPFEEVVTRALEMLRNTEESLLQASYFHPEHLAELAFDPRAYDFEHPVNKRPNYHFGQWDPHCIDQRGFYQRFVVQKVTLDALMARIPKKTARSGKRRQFLLEEAAAVLAGVILMASAVSGEGPESHDSSVTLGNLLPRIARCRDEFYIQLLDQMAPDHREQLLAEAKSRKQPFGGARQDLNAELSRRRANQLTCVHLAKLYSRMGYAEAAKHQIHNVRTPSAKLHCRIDRQLCECQRAIDRKQLDQAASLVADIIDELHRGIDCGALADPWSILGFQAQFSLFRAIENSIFDHRIEELLDLVHRIFSSMARLWSEAAAIEHPSLFEALDLQFGDFAAWWRQFAAHQVQSLECEDAQDIYRAAKLVAEAMRLWHRAGAEAGNVAFWKPHVALFDSPKAFGLVIRALLERGDLVASMALLINWLSQAERIALESSEASFSRLAEDWMLAARQQGLQQGIEDANYRLAERFLDTVEANAESLWRAPRRWQDELTGVDADAEDDGDDASEEPAEEGFGEDHDLNHEVAKSVWEGVSYVDSTDDGVDSETLDGGGAADTSSNLHDAAVGLAARLDFLNCVARMWRIAALWPRGKSEEVADTRARRRDSLDHWMRESIINRRDLLQLMDSVAAEALIASRGDQQSLLEYDRQRLTKDGLLEHIIMAYSEASFASLLLAAAKCDSSNATADDAETTTAKSTDSSTPNPQTTSRAAANGPSASVLPLLKGDLESADQVGAVKLLAAVLDHNSQDARKQYENWRKVLSDQPLLYVPLARGGQPRLIAEARVRQGTMRDLLQWLPRAGLLRETCELIETARLMERNHYVGDGAVTEFDELFTAGYRALVETVVDASQHWSGLAEGRRPDASDEEAAAEQLVASLEQLTESVLVSWLTHSRTLRLSVLERVHDTAAWEHLKDFIRHYGGDIFTQHFLNLGNVRAILHQGVDEWLSQLQEPHSDDVACKLLKDLGSRMPRDAACEFLSIILEAIIENYAEYRDYNSTTTQSDSGDQLYSLIDFLRLRSRYDRVCWNLRPVNLAHETLVRRNQTYAAVLWRLAITERIQPEADRYLKQLKQLQRRYSIRLHSVADRLHERFTHPLTIDRLRALVGPAIQDAKHDRHSPSFEALESEAAKLTEEQTGAGLETPMWLAALEEEAEQMAGGSNDDDAAALLPDMHIQLTYDDVRSQLAAWSTQNGRFQQLFKDSEDD